LLAYFNRNYLALPTVALVVALVALAVDRSAWVLVVLALVWLGLGLLKHHRNQGGTP